MTWLQVCAWSVSFTLLIDDARVKSSPNLTLFFFHVTFSWEPSVIDPLPPSPLQMLARQASYFC